ncbi:MAG: hypothetical protein GX800_12750 [Clostridiaceae bacterium]|nr:hypothetical protein [Clostridiaceae bacterium]
MYAKRLKRKCMVRGCKNTDTYSISHTRESGNSVIICIDCLIGGIKSAKKAEKSPKVEYVPTKPPELFFGTAIAAPAPAPVEDEIEEKFICERCGRECATKAGLINHVRACEKKVGEDDEN